MARLTIYVPDDLAAALDGSGLNVSRTCQEAIRQALGVPAPDERLHQLEARLDALEQLVREGSRS